MDLDETCSCSCGRCLRGTTVSEYLENLRDSDRTETTKERSKLQVVDMYDLQATGTMRKPRQQSSFTVEWIDELWVRHHDVLVHAEPADVVVKLEDHKSAKHTVVDNVRLTMKLIRDVTYSPKGDVAFTTGEVIAGNDQLIGRTFEMKTFRSHVRVDWGRLKKGDEFKGFGRIERNDQRNRYEYVVDGTDEVDPLTEEELRKAFGL